MIDTAKAESSTRTLLAQQTGANVKSVACPKHIAEKQGATFTCTATGADGTTAPVLIKQTDGKGHIYISATVLHTGPVAQQIAARLTRQFKLTVRVKCPDLLVAHRGTRLTCTATDPAGHRRTVAVTVTDNQGSIDYSLR